MAAAPAVRKVRREKRHAVNGLSSIISIRSNGTDRLRPNLAICRSSRRASEKSSLEFA